MYRFLLYIEWNFNCGVCFGFFLLMILWISDFMKLWILVYVLGLDVVYVNLIIGYRIDFM